MTRRSHNTWEISTTFNEYVLLAWGIFLRQQCDDHTNWHDSFMLLGYSHDPWSTRLLDMRVCLGMQIDDTSMTPTLESHLIRHPNILCLAMEVCSISQRSWDPLPMSRESWGTTHVPRISGNDHWPPRSSPWTLINTYPTKKWGTSLSYK